MKSMEKPKPKHRKGLWSPEEDQRLRDYIVKYGHGCWSSVPINAGLQRNGKSCRLRWINYLRPGLKRGMFTVHEEETILRLHRMLGNKWSQIARHLPGRTDNEIKNYWHSYLKKKLAKIEATTSHHIKSESDNSHTESTLFQEHFATQNPTSLSSLPRILFADWLTLDDNTPHTEDTFSGFDHQPLLCANGNTITSHSNLLQDDSSLVRSILLSGDVGGFEGRNENRNENFEDIMSGSSYYSNDIYGTMEDCVSEMELLELVSVDGVCSNNDLMYII